MGNAIMRILYTDYYDIKALPFGNSISKHLPKFDYTPAGLCYKTARQVGKKLIYDVHINDKPAYETSKAGCGKMPEKVQTSSDERRRAWLLEQGYDL